MSSSRSGAGRSRRAARGRRRGRGTGRGSGPASSCRRRSARRARPSSRIERQVDAIEHGPSARSGRGRPRLEPGLDSCRQPAGSPGPDGRIPVDQLVEPLRRPRRRAEVLGGERERPDRLERGEREQREQAEHDAVERAGVDGGCRQCRDGGGCKPRRSVTGPSPAPRRGRTAPQACSLAAPPAPALVPAAADDELGRPIEEVEHAPSQGARAGASRRPVERTSGPPRAARGNHRRAARARERPERARRRRRSRQDRRRGRRRPVGRARERTDAEGRRRRPRTGSAGRRCVSRRKAVRDERLESLEERDAQPAEQPKRRVVGGEPLEVAEDAARDAEEAHADDRDGQREDRRAQARHARSGSRRCPSGRRPRRSRARRADREPRSALAAEAEPVHARPPPARAPRAGRTQLDDPIAARSTRGSCVATITVCVRGSAGEHVDDRARPMLGVEVCRRLVEQRAAAASRSERARERDAALLARPRAACCTSASSPYGAAQRRRAPRPPRALARLVGVARAAPRRATRPRLEQRPLRHPGELAAPGGRTDGREVDAADGAPARLGSTSRSSSASSVDFPAPLGPTIATRSPGCSSAATPSSTRPGAPG